MVFPLTKLNKEGTLLNASHSYYTEEYAQRMCSLYLTDERGYSCKGQGY
ncbi:MAG: hypothetical protein SPK14_06170 [Lachnospiraceae bacterium]|nr:hypothetical protein [Lachnospiraceae bacterium]